MIAQEMLDEQVVYQKGCLRRIRRWWRGIHPDRGKVVHGLTGLETLEETDQILPTRTFIVDEPQQA